MRQNRRADNKIIDFVIKQFNENNPSPMEIAQRAGFRNHHELASFMAENGYRWSLSIGNYARCRKKVDVPRHSLPKAPVRTFVPADLPGLTDFPSPVDLPDQADLSGQLDLSAPLDLPGLTDLPAPLDLPAPDKYKGVLEFLSREQYIFEELLNLVKQNSMSKMFAVPESKSPVSFYISDRLLQKARMYCDLHNVKIERFFEHIVSVYIGKNC